MLLSSPRSPLYTVGYYLAFAAKFVGLHYVMSKVAVAAEGVTELAAEGHCRDLAVRAMVGCWPKVYDIPKMTLRARIYLLRTHC